MPKKSDYQPHQKKFLSARLPELEVVDNHYAQRDFLVHFEIPEFTCICPKTGQPDFATLKIDYAPAKKLVELKSLKLYVHGYRNVGVFHEHVANKVLDDLVKAVQPRRARLIADFNVRGGIHTVVTAAHRWPEKLG
ncbi:MAG TPA: preQ(1) synthase [bacterium]|jgi:7-cyano-7-deazaguanine reductase|nr:preQ(1) synthase [bacterium]